MHGLTRYLLSGAVVLIAVGALAVKYWDYLSNPWTRAGQVRANVIQVATRVSGPIVELPSGARLSKSSFSVRMLRIRRGHQRTCRIRYDLPYQVPFPLPC